MSKDNVIHVDFAKRKIIKPKKIEEPLRTPNKVEGAKYETPTYPVTPTGKVDKNGRKFSREALASMCEAPGVPRQHDWAAFLDAQRGVPRSTPDPKKHDWEAFLAAHEGKARSASDHDIDWEEFMRAQQGLPPKHPHGPLVEYVKEGCFPSGIGAVLMALTVLFLLAFLFSN